MRTLFLAILIAFLQPVLVLGCRQSNGARSVAGSPDPHFGESSWVESGQNGMRVENVRQADGSIRTTTRMACVNTLCQNGRCGVCGGLGFFYGSQCQSCYGTGKCMLCGGTGGQGVSQTWWPVFGRFVSDNGKSFLRVTSGTVGYFVSLWEVLLPGPYSARKEGDYYVLTAFNHPTVRVAIDLSKAHVEYNGVGGWHSLCSEEEYLRRFEVYKANNEVPRLVEGSPVQPSYGSGNQNAGATNGSVNEKRDCYMCVDGQCPVCTWHHGKCHHCNGSGQMYNSYTSDYQRCSYCNGRGNCYKCNGSGKCYRCHGKGYL